MKKKHEARKYQNFSRGIIIFLTVATLLLILLDFPFGQNNVPAAKNGVLSLKNHYFNAQGITSLAGEWEVYENIHVTGDTLAEGTKSVSSIDNTSLHSNQKTYRMVVEHRGENEYLGLRFPPSYENFSLYINGNLIDTYSYGSSSYAYFESGETTRMEILLHTTSQNHWFSGLNDVPEIGLREQIQNRMIRLYIADILLLVLLFASAILAFALHFMDEQSKVYRYLALSLLFALIAVSGLREGLLFRFASILPLLFTRKLADTAIPLSMLFLCHFFFERFPSKSIKLQQLKRLFFVINLVGSVLVLVLPFHPIASAGVLIISRILLITSALLCFLIALLAMGEHVPFSGSYTFAALLFFAATVVDFIGAIWGFRSEFSWFSLALLGIVPFAAFLKEFKDIRSDFGFTHFSLEQQINAAQMELEETKTLYEHQGMTDQITGVYSRSFGEHLLTQKTKENFGDVHPFTAILLDVDDFRRINHQYGFGEANKVLINTAVSLKDIIGEEDILCRWGSDEFLIFLPDCDAHQVAGRLKSIKLQLDRKNLSEREWISFCWAAATYGDRDTLLSFMKRLSDHMKEAKEEGRNSSSIDDFSPAFQMNLFSPSEEE